MLSTATARTGLPLQIHTPRPAAGSLSSVAAGVTHIANAALPSVARDFRPELIACNGVAAAPTPGGMLEFPEAVHHGDIPITLAALLRPPKRLQNELTIFVECWYDTPLRACLPVAELPRITERVVDNMLNGITCVDQHTHDGVRAALWERISGMLELSLRQICETNLPLQAGCVADGQPIPRPLLVELNNLLWMRALMQIELHG